LLRNLICQAERAIKAAYEGHATGEQVLTASETAIRGLADKHALGATSGRIRTWEQIPTLKLLPSADVSWVVEGVIPVGSIVLWAGESGSHKTWLSLWLAKAVQEGSDFLGRKTGFRDPSTIRVSEPIRPRQQMAAEQGEPAASTAVGGQLYYPQKRPTVLFAAPQTFPRFERIYQPSATRSARPAGGECCGLLGKHSA